MKLNKKYKHLFFDLDNTLFDFDACALLSLKECFDKYSLNRWFESFDAFYTVYAEINIKLWNEYKVNKLKKEDVKYGRFRKTLAVKNVEDEKLTYALAEDFLLFCSDKNILVDNALSVVKKLHENYSLYIISNGFVEVQNRKMGLTGLAPYFKKVVLSEEVKAQKPSRTIFEYAVKSVNARKSESVMIGDNIEADIEGARSFGMDQVYFDYNKLPENHGVATWTIQNLEELLEIF
ncbi:YjjG family noncanonical pyrimidine nucleotidase [Saccharicrinis sp. FJH54]|uniref:YjjG family noncanonical pyrimidine nucleotidase n=1 Tax=Saccharicrinis sp. FJH54 TaxID=3344665 RepID=UPI0035D4E633